MPNDLRTAIIVGASRGLGLGLTQAYLADGWRVVATVRRREGTEITSLGQRYPDRLKIELCDITNQAAVEALAQALAGTKADLLFVNAGISNGPGEIVEHITPATLSHLVVTNALGPLKVIDALRPIMTDEGVVAVMSSNLASITNNHVGGWEGYRASKSALNTMLRSYAARHGDSGLTFLAVSPGWVKTDMGGDDAPLDIGTSVAGIVNVIGKRTGRRGVAFVNYMDDDISW